MPEPPGPDIPGGGFGHMIHVSSDCTCQSPTDPRGRRIVNASMAEWGRSTQLCWHSQPRFGAGYVTSG